MSDKANFGAKIRELAAAAAEDPDQSLWSTDRTRYVQRVLLGWACYEGTVVGEDFHGRKVGVCSTKTSAQAWIDGAPTDSPEVEMEPFPPE